MVAIGRRVKVTYTGYLDDGTVFDSTESHGGEPLEFLVGHGQMIPGFDKAVSEMELGERRSVHIPAEMAYGPYREDLIERVPCAHFPNWERLPVGGFIAFRAGGETMRVKVERIEDGIITFDKNHELAGRDLNFDIELVDVHGESGSLVQQEHESGCACGCDRLKEAIDPLYAHRHDDEGESEERHHIHARTA